MNCYPCNQHPLIGTRVISTQYVIERTCEFLKVKPHDLFSNKRHAHIVEARHFLMLMFYSVKEWKLTYEKICEILKKTNHTTVLHGIKKIKNYLSYDSDLRFKYMMLNEYVFGSLEYYDF